LKGQIVAEIFSGTKQPGDYSMIWDAGNISAGVYVIKLEAGSMIGMKKCLVLK